MEYSAAMGGIQYRSSSIYSIITITSALPFTDVVL